MTDSNSRIMELLYKSKIINWSFRYLSEELKQYLIEHKEDILNRKNKGYWRNLMTNEDREQAKHPNRSFSWIPAYLVDRQNEHMYKILNELVGENNYDTGIFFTGNCIRCGSDHALENKLIEDMRLCLKSRNEGDSEFLDDSVYTITQFEKIRDECWESVTASHSPRTIATIDHTDFTQRSVPWSTNRIHGFCSNCWTNHLVKRMDELINLVI